MPTTVSDRAAKYLARVDQLYADIRRWFLGIDPGATFQNDGDVDLKEEDVGEYKAPIMVIQPSVGLPLRLTPWGCNVIDAEGRVEMRTPGAREALVYIEENPILWVGTGDARREMKLREQTGTGWAWERDYLKHDIPQLDGDSFRQLMKKLRR